METQRLGRRDPESPPTPGPENCGGEVLAGVPLTGRRRPGDGALGDGVFARSLRNPGASLSLGVQWGQTRAGGLQAG